MMIKHKFLDLTKTKNDFSYTVNPNEIFVLHLLDIVNANTNNTIKIQLKQAAQVKVLLSAFTKKSVNKTFVINFDHLENDAKSCFNSYLIASHLSKIKVNVISNIKPKTTNNQTAQEIKGVLLSNQATIQGEPQLIIDDNNVKAKHAMAIGRINPKQIFYLMSRGINQETAIQLILMGFFNATLSIIEDKALRKKYNNKVKKLFLGK